MKVERTIKIPLKLLELPLAPADECETQSYDWNSGIWGWKRDGPGATDQEAKKDPKEGVQRLSGSRVGSTERSE